MPTVVGFYVKHIYEFLKGAYGDAHVPNWLHRHLTPFPGITSLGLRWSKGECFEADNLSAPISSLLTNVCGRCDYKLLFFWILGLGVSGCHMSLK